MRRWTALFLALALCLGLLPCGALAADRKPVVKKVTYFNDGDEPTLQAEYEDGDGNNWIELYLVGAEVKPGDPKGPLGLIEIDGKTYHLRGIQTIDSSNKDQFYKDPKTGRWVVKAKIYLAGEKAPAPGEKVGVVIETGSDQGTMRKSDLIKIEVPAKGKKTTYPEEGGKTSTITFDANGGKGTMKATVVKNGVKTALPVNKFTMKEYLFIEWNTKKDGSGKAYKDGAKITVTEDTILYAQWGQISLGLSEIASIKKGKKLTLKATLLAGGAPVKGKKVTFKFKGKKYTAKTDKNGVAKKVIKSSVTKKLKAGKSVAVKVSFGGVTVQQSVKVTK